MRAPPKFVFGHPMTGFSRLFNPLFRGYENQMDCCRFPSKQKNTKGVEVHQQLYS